MSHVITDSVSDRKYFTHNFSLPAAGSTWPVGWISSKRGCCLCPSFRAGCVLSAGLPSRCLPRAPAHPGCAVPGCTTASVHCLDPGAAPVCAVHLFQPRESSVHPAFVSASLGGVIPSSWNSWNVVIVVHLHRDFQFMV